MAIDHGLQGKDSENSRRKRASKARKIKAISQSALTKDRKVLFNEESRIEYLTGFHKRKLLRRKYGIAMQILKDKKITKEKTKEKRSARNINSLSKESSNDSILSPDNEDHTGLSSLDDVNMRKSSKQNILGIEGESKESIVYDDTQTTNMFGSAVSVEIDTNIGDKLHLDPWKRVLKDIVSGDRSNVNYFDREMEKKKNNNNSNNNSNSNDDNNNSNSRNNSSYQSAYQQEFIKAIKKAKTIIGQKKSKRRKEQKGLELKAKLSGTSLSSKGGKVFKASSSQKKRLESTGLFCGTVFPCLFDE